MFFHALIKSSVKVNNMFESQNTITDIMNDKK